MRLKYQEVEVNMERMQCKTRKVIPAWETPVLQAVHPASEVLRDVCIETEAPSISGEYMRLETAYGNLMDGGNNISDLVIASVYGKGPPGLAELRRAMEVSRLPKNTPITVFDPPPTMRKDLLQALSADIATGDVLGDIPEGTAEEEAEDELAA